MQKVKPTIHEGNQIRTQLLNFLIEKEMSFRLFKECAKKTKLKKENWYDKIIVDVHYKEWRKLKLVGATMSSKKQVKK